METKEEIEQRVIELKNLKSIAMTTPGRQAVEDAIRRLSKRLKSNRLLLHHIAPATYTS